eukprot:scaffold29380_cov70-Phaeocystis_antarctica.AAC.8
MPRVSVLASVVLMRGAVAKPFPGSTLAATVGLARRIRVQRYRCRRNCARLAYGHTRIVGVRRQCRRSSPERGRDEHEDRGPPHAPRPSPRCRRTSLMRSSLRSFFAL